MHTGMNVIDETKCIIRIDLNEKEEDALFDHFLLPQQNNNNNKTEI